MPYIRYRGALYSDRVANPQSEAEFVAIPKDAVRIHIPDVRQRTNYSCGAACLQAVARYYGIKPFAREQDFVKLTEMDPKVGSHPDQIVLAAKRLGLSATYKYGMTHDEVKQYLEQEKPVLLSLQAHGDPSANYATEWQDGHWVVAIGFDDSGFFFEDPSLEAVRGYLSNASLTERWHDTVRRGKKKQSMGVVVWLESAPKGSFYDSFAQRIP